MSLSPIISRWGGMLVVALTVAAFITACGQPARSDEPSLALTEPPPATDAPPTAESGATATLAIQAPATPYSQQPYDPNRTMYGIWDGLGHDPGDSLAALEDTVFHNDKSQAYVILEALKFFNLDVARAGLDTLTELTGQDFDFDRRRWREFVGAREEEYAPPSDYGRWKVNGLAIIDPDMAALLEPGIERSRVNLTEVVWGGVRVDGIPPLEHPPHVLPEQATYLWPGDRVFGVSINGEHRAYPLRVMNAHELANDTLGGEPISLVY
ncbi:MAG: DUF3179 domain-containing protein [Chloroflexi bacterium]|nr:DUF3179 domain-containing protein [Chloroflexota bacterium]